MKLLLAFVLLNTVCSLNVCNDMGYTSWKQPQSQRDDLFCALKYCKCWSDYTGGSVDECCLCRSKADWEVSDKASDVGSLEVEYMSKKGSTIIIEPPGIRNKTNLQLIHKHGFMDTLPINLCSFPNIVKIDLTDNNIEDIEGISCISKLDTLILVKNNIRYITNVTFVGLSLLRILDLSENAIEKIEPFTFSRPELGILKILLPYNEMQTMDISNMALVKPFCEIDASYNQIETIVNDGDFVMDESVSYGEGGMVTLRFNEFREFPDFTKLGISDLTLLGKVLSFGFDFRNAKWNCDSKMVPLLQLGKDLIEKVWRDYMNVTCYCPERLRGESIPSMVIHNRLDEFTSEMKREDGCPHFCTCIFKPVSNITYVNCSSALLHMPKTMPDKGQLDIDFSKTQLSTLGNESYVTRINRMKLNHTPIIKILNTFIAGVDTKYFSFIDLSHTVNFHEIPTSFKLLDHCKVHFGQKTISCNCKSIWIQDWIDATLCNWNSSLTCETTKGFVSLTELSTTLGCEEENPLYRNLSIAFTVVLLLLSMTLGTVYLYRHEIHILLKRHKKPDEIKWNKFKFDAYISFNESNIQLRNWIVRIFLPDLQGAGYRIYCPLINAELGSSVDEDVIQTIGQSRNFIIFLSDEYLDGLETFDCIEGIRIKLEWRHAWNFYRKNRDRRIIIINYGQNRVFDIQSRELQAFLRVGKVLDFSDMKHTLLSDIKKLLGLPQRQYKGLGAKKTMFNPRENLKIITEKEIFLFHNRGGKKKYFEVKV